MTTVDEAIDPGSDFDKEEKLRQHLTGEYLAIYYSDGIPQPPTIDDFEEGVTYLLEHEVALVAARLANLRVVQDGLTYSKADAVGQSTENMGHDDAVQAATEESADQNVYRARDEVEMMKVGNHRIIVQPSPDDPAVRIGSRVTLQFNGEIETFDLVGHRKIHYKTSKDKVESGDEEADKPFKVTVSNPLIRAVYGMTGGQSGNAIIHGDEKLVHVVSVDQASFMAELADQTDEYFKLVV